MTDTRRDFFPVRTTNGILLPGNESEIFLNWTSAQWHRRRDWESGKPQIWQTSTMPSEVAWECANAVSGLLDADVELRSLAQSVLNRLVEGQTPLVEGAVPGPSPYEPQKTLTGEITMITFPGGFAGDLSVTFTREVSVAGISANINKSFVSWRIPHGAAQQHGDIPSDVVSDAVAVLERQIDLAQWLRHRLTALQQR